MKRIAVILSILSCTSIAYGQPDTMFTAGQTGTYSSNVRGYWFVAPSDFVITKLYVPTDANSGNQSIAVMKMNVVASFPNTTNNFDLLYLVQDTSELGWISVNIPVTKGDQIGILGCRSDVNSYSIAPQNVTINGSTVTLTRLGMQYSLSTTDPKDIFISGGNRISRVFFEYYCTGSSCVCRSISPPNVTNASSSTSSDGSISIDLSTDNNNIRYLRWATKDGVNYPATNAEDVNGLAPGDYTLFFVTKDYLPCYVGPVTVGP